MNTDDHNRLSTKRLPPANDQRGMRRLQALNSSFQSQEVLDAERLAEVDAVAVLRRMAWNGERQRTGRLAKRLSPAQTAATRGWLNLDNGFVRNARTQFGKAIALDSTLPAARLGTILVGDVEALDSLGPEDRLSRQERTLLEARRRTESKDWQGIRALDQDLASFAPSDLPYSYAARLRVLWRLETGEATRAAEAIGIVDTLLSRERSPEHYLLRARAAAAAEQEAAAWAALDVVAARGVGRPQTMRRALELAGRLGPPPEGSTVLERLALGVRPRRR
jgi:hypothetical protein